MCTSVCSLALEIPISEVMQGHAMHLCPWAQSHCVPLCQGDRREAHFPYAVLPCSKGFMPPPQLILLAPWKREQTDLGRPAVWGQCGPSQPPAHAWMLVLTGERGRKPSLQARDTEVPTPYPFFPTLKTLILSGSFCPFFLSPSCPYVSMSPCVLAGAPAATLHLKVTSAVMQSGPETLLTRWPPSQPPRPLWTSA